MALCLGAGPQPRWDVTPEVLLMKPVPGNGAKGPGRFGCPCRVHPCPPCAAEQVRPLLHSAACGWQSSFTQPQPPSIPSLVPLFVVGSHLYGSLPVSLSPKLNPYELLSNEVSPSSESRAATATERWRGVITSPLAWDWWLAAW